MTVHDPQRLRLLLGTEAWRWWRERARRHLESGRLLPATLSCAHPDAQQLQAADRLFGRPGHHRPPLTIAHAQLIRELVKGGIADDLVSCLEVLDGPLRDRPGEAARWEEGWSALGAQAAARLAQIAPRCGAALDACLEDGFLRRISGYDLDLALQLLDQAMLVFAALRVLDQPSLAVLAARATGDAHALDRDSSLGRLVLRIAAGGMDEPGILAWRRRWSELGVRADAVSASVLVLNLRLHGGGTLANLLNAAADAGEPLRLTARILSGELPQVSMPNSLISVCENPSVVSAAADRFGARATPMICVDGQPTSPALALLGQLSRRGVPCRYHGDFDWPGLAIAADLIRLFGVSPWRMRAQDLLGAASLPGPALIGEAVETRWDPPLREALLARGRALHEETVIEDLLSDLEAAPADGE